MAIQAQIYPDFFGFPPFNPPEFHGGGAVWMNPQRQQFLQNKVSEEMETKTETETETRSFRSLDYQPGKQGFEIDHFILSQNERLTRVVREQRKRDVTELLRKIEARTSFLLSRKHQEIANAKTRTSQLESLLMKLQTDTLTWQQLAKQNELQVISLNNTIQLLQQQQQQQLQVYQWNEPLVEDSESCCDEEQRKQSYRVDKMVCRVCERREVGVVMLPCRHMCACIVCDPMIDSCPVCHMEKKCSVEAVVC